MRTKKLRFAVFFILAIILLINFISMTNPAIFLNRNSGDSDHLDSEWPDEPGDHDILHIKGIANEPNFTRVGYPLIIRMDEQPQIYSALQGLNESHIRVLYYNTTNHWVQVPYQIDEKGWILTWQDGDDDFTTYFPILNYSHVFVSKNGTDNYEPSYGGDTQVPYAIDYDDELCFHVENGRSVSPQTWWNHTNFPHRLCINITDPVDNGQSFMYIYYNNQTPQEIPKFTSYVNWDPNTLTITTQFYQKRFKNADPDIVDLVRVLAPGSDGMNIVEEMDKSFAHAHIRIDAGIMGTWEGELFQRTYGTWGTPALYYNNSACGIDNPNNETVQLGQPDPGMTPGWTDWDTQGDRLAVKNGPIRVILLKQLYAHDDFGTGFFATELYKFETAEHLFYNNMEQGDLTKIAMPIFTPTGTFNYDNVCFVVETVRINSSLRDDFDLVAGGNPDGSNPDYPVGSEKYQYFNGNDTDDDLKSGGDPTQTPPVEPPNPENLGLADWTMVTSQDHGGMWMYMPREEMSAAILPFPAARSYMYYNDVANYTELGAGLFDIDALIWEEIATTPYSIRIVYGPLDNVSDIAWAQREYKRYESTLNNCITCTLTSAPGINTPIFEYVTPIDNKLVYENGETIQLDIQLDASGYTVTVNYSTIDSAGGAAESAADMGNGQYLSNHMISQGNTRLEGTYTINVTALNTTSGLFSYSLCDLELKNTTSPRLIAGGTDVNYELGSPGPINAAWTWTDSDPDIYFITQAGVGVVDNGTWASGVAIQYDVSGLGLGTHSFRCTVQDGSANSTNDVVTVTVSDTTPPGLASSGGNINYELGDPGAYTASWTWNDFDPYNYTMIEVGVGVVGSGTWTWGTPITWDVSGLGLGVHTFVLNLEDGSGNPNSEFVVVTVLDTVAPVLSAGGTNVNCELGATGPVWATWTWTDFDPDNYTITQAGVGVVDSGTWVSGVPIQYDISGLGLGIHNFTCSVQDGLSNPTSDNVTVTISDTTSPVLGAGGVDINYNVGVPGSIWANWTWTDFDADTYTITQAGVGVVDSGSWASGVPLTWNVSGLSTGTHTFTCSVQDGTSNPASDVVTVIVGAATAPVLSAGGSDIVYEFGAPGPINASWNWTDLDPNNYTILQVGVGEVDNGTWVSGVPITWDVSGLGLGVHTFNCSVDDGTGTPNSDFVRITVYDTIAPVLAGGGLNINYELGASGPYTATWTWTDLEPNIYTITQVGVGVVDSGVWTSGVPITWDVTGLGIGAHPFRCDVQDVAGNSASDDVRVTVSCACLPSLIAGGTDFNYELDTPGPYTATWTWTDLDPDTYTIIQIGVGMVDSGPWTSGVPITCDVSGLGLGVHTFRCDVQTGGGLSGIDDVIVSVSDTMVPILNIGGTNIAYNSSDPGPHLASWIWTDFDPDTYTITQVGVGVVDSGTWSFGVPITWNVSGLGPGIHTFTCSVQDGSSNTNSDNVTVIVSPTPPPALSAGGSDISYELGDPGPYSATWTWTDDYPDIYIITQAGVGIVDNGTWVSGVPLTWNVSGLSTGTHFFTCYTLDREWNMSHDVVEVTVTDATAPILSAGGTDINYEFGALGPFTANWTWTDIDANAFNITRVGVGIVDSGAWTSGTPLTWDVSGLGPGIHIFTCNVDDGSGLSNSDNVTVTVQDTTPPVLFSGGGNIIYEEGAPGPIWATWTWTDLDPDNYTIVLSGVGTVDSSAWFDLVPITWDVSGMTEGIYNFTCTVNDGSSNPGFDQVTVTVTYTPPPPILPPNIGYELGDPGPFVLSWTWYDNDPATYAIERIGVGTVDNGTWFDGVPITWDVTGLGLGPHTFRCTVEDGSSNSAFDDATVTVSDMTDPSLQAGGGDIPYELGDPAIYTATWTWMDEDPDTYTIMKIGVGVVDSGIWTNMTAITLDVSGLWLGGHTFRCDVNDGTGNIQFDDVTVTVSDTTPPILSAGGTDINYPVGDPGPHFATWTWMDEDPDNYTIRQIGVGVNDTGLWANMTALTLDVTGLSAGVYTFRCEVEDGTGLTNFDDVIITTGPNIPILSAGGTDITYELGDPATYTATWTWTDDNPNQYNITRIGVGQVDTGGWVSGTPITWDVSGLGHGVHTFECSVDDLSALSDADNVTVTVSDTTNPSLQAGGGNIAYELGDSGTYTATWTWVDEDPDNYTIREIGVGIVDSGAWVSGTPLTWDVTGLGLGVHTFTCDVDDGSGNLGTDDVVVTVTDTTPPDLPSECPNIAYELGAPGPFTVFWTWTDLDANAYNITQIGVGIVDNGTWSSGVSIIWDVTGLGVGAYTFRCDVDDGTGNTNTDDVIVTVSDTTSPVLSAGGMNINYLFGEPGPFTATWTWTDLDAWNYNITQVGVGIVDSGAWTSGTPITWDVTGLGLGTHTFTCDVDDGSGNPGTDNVIVNVTDTTPPILASGGGNINYELGAPGPFAATWTWTDLDANVYNITRVGVGIVDSGAWTSGVPFTWDVTGLGVGAHTFRCDVDDGSGNSNTDDVIVTVTDTTSPVLTAGGTDFNYEPGLPGPIWANWTWTDLDPDNYTITQSGVGVVDSGLWSSGVQIQYDVSGLGVGTYTFTCTVEDGSINSYSDPIVVGVGGGLPLLIAGGDDINYELGAAGPFTATWTWTDVNPNQYNVTQVGIGIVDSGTWSSGVPITWDVTGLGVGVHTFICNVDDLLGKPASDIVLVTVTDTVPPALTAGGGNINYELGALGPFTATWTWTDLDANAYTITQVGVGVVDSGPLFDMIPITGDVTGLGLGAHTFRCEVEDGSTNPAQDDVIVTVTDTTAPVLSADGNSLNYDVGDPGPIWANWTFTDLDPDNYIITKAGVGTVASGFWTSGVQIQYDVSGMTEGIYNFICTVNDSSSNSGFDQVTVTVTYDPPFPILPTDIYYELGTPGPYVLSWTWFDDDPVSYEITQIGVGTLDNGTWFDGVPIMWDVTGLGLGPHTFRCTVEDASNNSAFNDVTVTVSDTTPPILSASGTDINYEFGAPGPFTATWTWTDLDANAYNITRVGVGVVDVGAWASGTPITWDVTGLGVGTYIFECAVQDGSTNPAADNVTVSVSDGMPILTAGGTDIAYELGAAGPFTAMWNWTDANSTEYNITQVGVGIVDNGTWTSGTPITWDVTGLGLGVHTFRCDVDDGSGNSNYDDVVVTVSAITPPVLTAGGGDINYELGNSGPHVATWTWTDGTPNQYNITQIGVGIVDSGAWISGVAITWDVTGLGLGTHVFECSVNDGFGLSNADNVTVTVTDTIIPALTAGGTDINYELGTPGPIWANWTWTDLDADNYTITQAGVGVVDSGFWTSGIQIQHDVSGLAIGTYTFTCSVQDGSGNPNSDVITVTVEDTTPPTPPQIGSPVVTADRVTLIWNLSPEPDVDHYNIYRSNRPITNITGLTPIASVGSSVNSYTDSGLADGTYYYVITAVDGVGQESILSNSITAKIMFRGYIFIIFIIIFAIVGSVAVTGTVSTVVILRRRSRAKVKATAKAPAKYQPSRELVERIEKLSTPELPPGLKEFSGTFYILAEEEANMLDLKYQIEHLPLTEEEKRALLRDLQGLPAGEREVLTKKIIGEQPRVMMQIKLDGLLKEINVLEKEKKWNEALKKIEEAAALAEWLGKREQFDGLLMKYDEFRGKLGEK